MGAERVRVRVPPRARTHRHSLGAGVLHDLPLGEDARREEGRHGDGGRVALPLRLLLVLLLLGS